MYLQHFELSEYPFLLTVDTHFLYESRAHTQAKAAIGYALSMRDSLLVISGEIGSGKTTLIQDVKDNLDGNVRVATVSQTQLTDEQFLRAVLVEFGFRPFDADKSELLTMIKDHLVNEHATGHRVLLVVDEAQNLDPRTLEEVRMLTGLEAGKEKLVNVILVGQPELNQTLALPKLQQMAQRIRLRFHLHPLSAAETREYVEHRLAWAGRRDRALFEDGTFSLIYGYTGGVPRLINIICDMAMTTAFTERGQRVTPGHVQIAIRRLQWRPYTESIYLEQPMPADPNSTATARPARATSAPAATAPPEAQDLPNARLVHRCKESLVTEYVLNREYMRIGRTANCHIRIADPQVSRAHAQIVCTTEVTCVEDLGSRNGTRVNSKRVRRCELKHGDVITIGDHELIYHDGAADERLVVVGGRAG